jgi:pimeloyl-ACP methyl ester carboxylesterase
MNFNQTLKLADGRTLGFAEYGDLAGKPVIGYFGISSRRYYPLEDSITTELGVRLITVDRPGLGLSDPKPERTLLNWAEDVGELAEGLGLNRWGVIGIQEGGPDAAALAFKSPSRVGALSLISSPAPTDAPVRLDRPNPLNQLSALWKRYTDRQPPLTPTWIRQNPVMTWRRFHHGLPVWDGEVVRIYGPRYLKPSFMRDKLDEVFRQGLEGVEQAEALLAQPWGFSLAETKTPTTVWQGELDELTPVPVGRYLSQTIPGAAFKLVPEEGHWLYLKFWQEILLELLTRL